MSEKAVTTTPFGKFVKKRLVDLEWTLEDLSKHAEISRTQLSRVFSGKLPLTQDIANALEEVLVPFTDVEWSEFNELLWSTLSSVTIDISRFSSADTRELAFRFSKLLDIMTQSQIEEVALLLDVIERRGPVN